MTDLFTLNHSLQSLTRTREGVASEGRAVDVRAGVGVMARPLHLVVQPTEGSSHAAAGPCGEAVLAT